MRDSPAKTERPVAERTRSLTEAIYAHVREDILTARLLPGTKLRIGELCARYGFSSTPVREALTQLAAEGLVRREDMRGFFVAEASAEEFLDLTETRCMVEQGALARSIERGGEDWEARIVVAFHRLSRVPRPSGGELFENNPQWVSWHDEFHDALIGASGSKLVAEFCRQLRDRSYRYRRIASFERADGWLAEHQAIMQATLNREGDRAARLLEDHYRRTAEITLRRWTTLEAKPAAPRRAERRARVEAAAR